MGSSSAVPVSDAIVRAASLLRSGGLVAFPTETVYGLGANALDAGAVARIYAAKGRPAWNPVIVHVASIDAARALVTEWPDDAQRLAEAFWPGPLTLVLPRSPNVPDIVTAGLGNVALRIPAHPMALELLRECGVPVAAPSANRFTAVSPTTAAHVIESLGDRVDMVLDGGPSDVGIESTVIDVLSTPAIVLRPGMVSRDHLQEVLGREVQYRSSAAADGLVSQPAPGQAARHYAPNSDVWLFQPDEISEVLSAASQRQLSGTNAAVTLVRAFSTSLRDDAFASGAVEVHRMPAVPELYARELYAALRSADTDGIGLLLIELPPAHDAWTAVHDRLTRAAH
ncbi:MAG TPA: L-threonylcarbamoyladenylate synthase [Gemmatimonas sp.]|nr:L-threonylcarbamoyladenylate synthase [Gemmatimonas sp.]